MRCSTRPNQGSSRKARHDPLPGGVQPLEPRQLLNAALAPLVTFDNAGGGTNPMGALVMDASGNLYGAADAGGALGKGTLFEIAAGSSAATTLATFNGANGANPASTLAADAAGNLYGTTSAGGPTDDGTVFELAAGTHAVTTLANFNFSNGSRALAGLYIDSAGNLFGTTSGGGANYRGTVFEIPAGTQSLTTLVSFTGAADGANPFGRLIADASGNLYGTTGYGGTINGSSSNQGTVFELDSVTHTLTTLATLDGNAGYSHPQAGLLLDGSGNLIGTTYSQVSGAAANDGTVFMVAAGTHAVSTLSTFNGANGGQPYGDLIADADGNLFGTTQTGGANGVGSVFEIDAATHTLTTIASLDGGTTGAYPQAGLVAGANGILYGVAESGGANNLGTVFQLTGSGFMGAGTPQVPPAPPAPPVPPPTLAPAVMRSTVPALVVTGTSRRGGVTLRVTNDTASRITGRATIDLYASSDGTIDDASTLVATAVRRVRLAAGRSQVMGLPVKLPAALASGAYTLLARVADPSSYNTDAPSGPGLRVAPAFIALSETFARLMVPNPLAAPGRARAAAVIRITNHGNITSAGPTSVSLYLSRTGQLDGTATLLKTVTRRLAIPAGKKTSLLIPVTQIPTLATGNYFAVLSITDPQSQSSAAVAGTPIAVIGT
jgi:uncharacterized repeat protein (TIGR03803 family)